jgi:hypothetical protein
MQPRAGSSRRLRARLAAAALAAAAASAGGCSWHRFGEADGVVAAPDLPSPAAGDSLAEVFAVADAVEQGDFSVRAELLRVAKIAGGIWEDVPEKRARRADFVLEPGADYVVVVGRECSDWVGRERWSDERTSWFLLHDGRVLAFDHFRFGARCGLANAFRPVPADSPARANERDLLRWLEQRRPPGRLPVELRFARGHAYVAAGRLEEAEAMLRFADDALDAREDLMSPREVSDEEAAAFEAEGRRLRGLRGDLSAAIREARRAEVRP